MRTGVDGGSLIAGISFDDAAREQSKTKSDCVGGSAALFMALLRAKWPDADCLGQPASGHFARNNAIKSAAEPPTQSLLVFDCSRAASSKLIPAIKLPPSTPVRISYILAGISRG